MSILAAYAVPHPPLIIPGVGRGREAGIQDTVDAYEEVGRRVAALAPQTIVVSTPHSVMYYDYFHISPGAAASGDFRAYGDFEDEVSVPYDQAFVRTLEAACQAVDIAAGTLGERDAALDHATMIPLHFVRKHWGESGGASAGKPFPRVVRIGLSGFGPDVHYQLGQLVQQTADVLGRDVVYIGSGDLSHKLTPDGPYGFAPDGPVFDERIEEIFRTGDLLGLLTMDPGLADRAAECGLRSFQIMAGALDGTPVRAELLSHEGPFGVGYGVACFTPCGPEASDDSRRLLEQYRSWARDQHACAQQGEDLLVRLARQSLESWVTSRERIRPTSSLLARLAHEALSDGASRDDVDELLEELRHTRAGCFVSLKVHGELRGCIGTILPVRDSLAEEICANAISAGSSDPRFPPVRVAELDQLVYDVDVLTEPEPVDSAADLDVRRYGVIVSTPDGRRGLLLPDLDGVDTVDEQLDIAARKGGIDLVSDDVRLERFEVVRHL